MLEVALLLQPRVEPRVLITREHIETGELQEDTCQRWHCRWVPVLQGCQVRCQGGEVLEAVSALEDNLREVLQILNLVTLQGALLGGF